VDCSLQVSLLEHLYAFPPMCATGHQTIRRHEVAVWIKDAAIYHLSRLWSTIFNGPFSARVYVSANLCSWVLWLWRNSSVCINGSLDISRFQSDTET
jgi:hypothetical protein